MRSKKKIDVNREQGRDEENRMDAKEEKVRETHNSCVLSLAVTLGDLIAQQSYFAALI